MTDPANQPAPRSKSFRIGIWLAVIVGGAALLSAFVFPLCSALNQTKANAQNFHRGRQLFSVLEKYAHDHDERFPPSLKQLVPQYLTEDALDQLGYTDAESNRRYEWIYFPGATLTSPPDTPLCAAPAPAPAPNAARQVIQVGGRQDFPSERIFREQRPDRAGPPKAP